jgi:hypothetical protein
MLPLRFTARPCHRIPLFLEHTVQRSLFFAAKESLRMLASLSFIFYPFSMQTRGHNFGNVRIKISSPEWLRSEASKSRATLRSCLPRATCLPTR